MLSTKYAQIEGDYDTNNSLSLRLVAAIPVHTLAKLSHDVRLPQSPLHSLCFPGTSAARDGLE